jgi:hypothetical protein
VTGRLNRCLRGRGIATLRAGSLAVLLAVVSCNGYAQGRLDSLGERLTVISDHGSIWARLSSTQELALYFPEADLPEEHPPGLLYSDASPFVAPRLTVALDAGFGEGLLAHAKLRADRGFDPGAERSGDVRIDEYFVQAEMLERRVAVRVGKFATAFGGWVERHASWDNPLISAPTLYEDMVTIRDLVAPPDVNEFAGLRDAAENRETWVPVIWGPSYASGMSISGDAGALDLTLEIKNAALSSRPDTWDVWDRGFRAPTVSGRLGWRPSPTWTLGVSGSHGAYLQRDARGSLPAGRSYDDFSQTTYGVDASYERHLVQIWAELARTRFDVPRVGDVDALIGFVEARYKPAPRWWLAGRWNTSHFDDVPGLDRSWDRNLRRVDFAVGFRSNAHFQIKVEYSAGDQAGRDTGGNRLLAAQAELWF